MLRILAAVLMMLTMVSAIQAEMIDNPEYLQWSEFKPGASATIVMVSEAAGTKTKMKMTRTLKSLDEDKAVVETVTVMEVEGKEIKQPTQSRTISARIEKPKEPAEGEKPEVKEGEETVKVPAGTFKCKTIETHMKQGDRTIITKTWVSPEVPGGQVKMTMKSDGTPPMSSASELTAVSKGGE